MRGPLATLYSVLVLLLAQAPEVRGQTLDELPPRKPGHWEIRIVTEKPSGVPVVTTQVCIDAATDRDVMEFGLRASRKSCKHYAMKREGKAVVIEAECKLGPLKNVTRATMLGDFQSNYSVRMEGTTDAGFLAGNKGPQQTLVTQTARWTSASCPNGMAPGDIALGNGKNFNIKQVKGLQNLLPQLQIK